MKILLLVGNGFDLAQHAKTRYSDFYEEYKKCTPVNTLEKQMIDEITGDKTATWADLEVALGKFTSKSDNQDEFEALYFHLVEELASYLKRVDVRMAVAPNEKILKDVFNPIQYLSPAENVSLSNFLQGFGIGDIYINIISFNYTTLLERMLDYKKNTIKSSSFLNPSYHSILQIVRKIHGELSGTPLLGVNDESQIANKSFASNPDVTDYLIKPHSNKVLGSLVDEKSLTDIKNCNLFLIHGVSLGDTDKMWWQAIGMRMLADPTVYVVIYYYDAEISDDLHATLIGRKKRKVRNLFFKACGIDKEKISKVESRVFVCINSGFMVGTGS